MTKLLTPAQCGEILGVAAGVVIAHIRAGRLIASNISLGSSKPRFRIAVEDLELFIAATRTQPPAKRKKLVPDPRSKKFIRYFGAK